MCIAILKTKSGIISDEILKNCFKNNPDGAGIAYTVDNKLYIVKGIFKVKKFIKAVRQAESIADSNILIHCRISTSGLIDKDNSHPHVVNSTTVLIHNGILNIDVPKNSKQSDTVLFIEKYLRGLPEDFIYNDSILKLIEDKIGTGNKFVFLNSKGDYKILNEDRGYWIDNVWYSNQSYEDYTKYFRTTKHYKYNNKSYKLYDWTYEDDYYDENKDYLDNYGMNRGQFLDIYLDNYPTIIKDVKKSIDLLRGDELDYIGDVPVVDIITGELKPYTTEPRLYEYFLDELDCELQEYYNSKYYIYDYEEDEANV